MVKKKVKTIVLKKGAVLHVIAEDQPESIIIIANKNNTLYTAKNVEEYYRMVN